MRRCSCSRMTFSSNINKTVPDDETAWFKLEPSHPPVCIHFRPGMRQRR